MENLFSIGELAKYQNISKQTLIFYDKIGLFRPAWVDPDNGYRYYSAAQLDFLDTILIMKKIGFSLKEIQEHMKHYTIDSSLVLLRSQLTRIDQQIAELNLIRSRLAHRELLPPAARGGACGADEGPVYPLRAGAAPFQPPGDKHRHQKVLCRLL